MARARTGGFTLVELVIGLAIAAILTVLALPNYMIWLADAQIRAASESIATGLRFAQGEAVKRNQQVEFTINPITATGGWTTTLVIDGSTLQSAPFEEGSHNVAFATIPGAATTVTFTGLGQIGPNAVGPTLTEIDVTTATGIANTRNLNVLVGGGASGIAGQGNRTGIKLCDPQANIKFGNNDPKACPI